MENLTTLKVENLIKKELEKYSEFNSDIHLFIAHTMDRGFKIYGGLIKYNSTIVNHQCYVYDFCYELNMSGKVVNVLNNKPIISFEEVFKEDISYLKGKLKEANNSYKAEFGKNLYPTKYTK